VFGCGGDRDKLKRPKMGKVAEEFADKIYITDDNPRTENAENIRQEIIKSCGNAEEISNRKLAIKRAIENLKNGDVLVVAGKGHEVGQIVGDKIIPHEDAKVISEIIENIVENI
jgi:UDP-N-acetylmuramoyl-L-alanyl-D-glutamate--2,6-diaminopimelate ligase